MQEPAALVSRDALESLLGCLERECGDPRAGIFGPGSMTWKVSRESAVFLGAGRAALLQLAHPWVAAALEQHSNLLHKPIERFHNTFRIVFAMVFGSLPQAMAAARHLHTLHTHIRGELPEAVAAWPAGSPYEANFIPALRWVYATLVESAVLACSAVLPLAAEEREQYYQESKTMAALFGLPPSELPPDWRAFEDYNRQMAESAELGVSGSARQMAQSILRGAGSWIHPPHWYRAITKMWLPERFQREFGLGVAEGDRGPAERALRWLPRAYAVLPPPMRYVGPYLEARARLKGRGAGLLVRGNTRFWIGQTRIPFAEGSDLGPAEPPRDKERGGDTKDAA